MSGNNSSVDHMGEWAVNLDDGVGVVEDEHGDFGPFHGEGGEFPEDAIAVDHMGHDPEPEFATFSDQHAEPEPVISGWEESSPEPAVDRKKAALLAGSITLGLLIIVGAGGYYLFFKSQHQGSRSYTPAQMQQIEQANANADQVISNAANKTIPAPAPVLAHPAAQTDVSAERASQPAASSAPVAPEITKTPKLIQQTSVVAAAGAMDDSQIQKIVRDQIDHDPMLSQIPQTIQAMQQTLQSQSQLLANYQQKVDALQAQVSSLSVGGVSTHAVQAPADWEKRLTAVEQKSEVALGDAHLALRRTGYQIAGAAPKSTPKPKAAPRHAPAPVHAEGTAGWSVVGIGGGRAMVKSPEGKTYLVSVGKYLPNLGKVEAIDAGANMVKTPAGTIRG